MKDRRRHPGDWASDSTHHLMQPSSSSDTDRREFLRRALRFSALTAMAGLVASAVARRDSVVGRACEQQRLCNGCWKLPNCNESQAKAAREAALPGRHAS